MRYIVLLVAYLVAAAFYPTFMGLAGLVALSGWLMSIAYKFFVPPVPVEEAVAKGVKQGPGPVIAVTPEPQPTPAPVVFQAEQVESDEEFLARMRAQNQ